MFGKLSPDTLTGAAVISRITTCGSDVYFSRRGRRKASPSVRAYRISPSPRANCKLRKPQKRREAQKVREPREVRGPQKVREPRKERGGKGTKR